MNIAMVLYGYYLTDARVKAYVHTLLEEGHKVDVIALREKGQGKKEIQGNLTIYYLTSKYQGTNKLAYIFSYFLFLFHTFFFLSIKYTFQRNYDIIHIHNLPDFIIFSAFWPWLWGAKIILDVHDIITTSYQARFGLSEKHPLMTFLIWEIRLSAAFAHFIICADHFQRELLIEYGLSPNKVIALLNLANEAVFSPQPLQPVNDTFNLVYPGTIAKQLGIDLALQAIAKIDLSIPIRFFIIGLGDYLGECIKLAEELNIKDRVHFTKCFYPLEELQNHLRNMHLGIVPYRKNIHTDKYGLSVKLLEFAYIGLPAVVPSFTNIQYYFDDTMVKFFTPENVIELAEAIVELYNDSEKRAELVHNARRFCQKYNWQTQKKIYLDLIQFLIKS